MEFWSFDATLVTEILFPAATLIFVNIQIPDDAQRNNELDIILSQTFFNQESIDKLILDKNTYTSFPMSVFVYMCVCYFSLYYCCCKAVDTMDF